METQWLMYNSLLLFLIVLIMRFLCLKTISMSVCSARVCVRACAYACLLANRHACIMVHACMHACVCVCVCVCVHVRVHACVYACRCSLEMLRIVASRCLHAYAHIDPLRVSIHAVRLMLNLMLLLLLWITLRLLFHKNNLCLRSVRVCVHAHLRGAKRN